MSRHETFDAAKAVPIAPQASPSRLEVLAAEYDRWHALYRHVGSLEGWHDHPIPKDTQEKFDIGTGHAVRRMHEIMDELIATPARTLRDFALKAMVVRENKESEWFDTSTLDRDELLCRGVMIELMTIMGIDPLPIPDFEPKDVFPDYRDATDWSADKYTRRTVV